MGNRRGRALLFGACASRLGQSYGGLGCRGKAAVANYWEELERLSRLRSEGALTDAEFDAEKERVLKGRAAARRVRLGVAVALVAARLGALLFWLSGGIPARPTPSSPQGSGPATVPIPPLQATLPPPAADPTLADAFKLAFPTVKRRVRIGDGTESIKFTPKIFQKLSADSFVLVSEGNNIECDAHVCSGAFAVTYFGLYPELKKEGEDFIRASSNGGFGQPPGLRIRALSDGKHVLEVTKGYGGMGLFITSVDLMWLGLGPNELRDAVTNVLASYEYQDASVDNSPKCVLTSKFNYSAKGGLQVLYNGSGAGVVNYREASGSLRPDRGVEAIAPCIKDNFMN